VELLSAEFFSANDRLQLDKKTQDILAILFQWVIGEYEPTKGFVLTGTYGTGKSSVMKATMNLAYYIFRNEQYPNMGMKQPRYVSAKELSRTFMNNDEAGINSFIYSQLIGIDDFGYESKKVRSFGTEVYPFEEVIMERYDRKKIILGTTNMSAEQIGNTYGGHVLDRLNQMCFFVEIKAPSKRS